MLFGLFLTLGVAVLSVALRSFQSSFSQKAGALGILISSYLAIYFITSSWVLGLRTRHLIMRPGIPFASQAALQSVR